ncbi:MAG: OmpA family protein [Leptospiraceae bacterium]|nr:OmpA family protein [Leptospiraceae bacterium]
MNKNTVYVKVKTYLILLIFLFSFQPIISQEASATRGESPTPEKSTETQAKEEEATDWFYFRSEYAELLKKKKAGDKEINKLKDQKLALEKENKDLKEKLAVLQFDLKEVGDTKTAFQQETDLKIKILDKTIKSLTERQLVLEGRISSLNKEKSTVETKANSERTTNLSNLSNAEKEMKVLQETIANLEKEKKELSDNNKKLTEEIEKLKEENTKLASKLKESEEKYTTLLSEKGGDTVSKDTIVTLKRDTKKLQKENRDLQETILKLNQDLSERKENEIRLSQENLRLRREIDGYASKQKEELEEVLVSEIKNGEVNIQQNGKRLVINLYDKITFDSGSAKLKKSGKKALNKILSSLNKYKGQKILIEGNTDNLPIHNSKYPDNWHLSVARSIAVMKYLIKKGNVYPKDLSVVGNGPYNPLKKNNSKKNRAMNRRVDLIVTPIEYVH